MNVIPAILTDSFLTFQEELQKAQESSQVDTIHIDIIDGMFADEITLTPLDLTVADFEPLKVDFHLMTEEPMDFVFECAGLREYLPIRQVIGQIERMSHQLDFVEEVLRNGWQPALAIDIFTPLESIDQEVWPQLRSVMIMSVEAGAQNQIFNRVALEKVREIRRNFPHAERMNIMVDGGVKTLNAREILASGANELVVGSNIWKSRDPVEVIHEFHELAQ
ncbi:ribulose-phosphate 3-epimerase [soil metagenome]